MKRHVATIVSEVRRLSIKAREIERRTSVKEGRVRFYEDDRHLPGRMVPETDGVRR